MYTYIKKNTCILVYTDKILSVSVPVYFNEGKMAERYRVRTLFTIYFFF